MHRTGSMKRVVEVEPLALSQKGELMTRDCHAPRLMTAVPLPLTRIFTFGSERMNVERGAKYANMVLRVFGLQHVPKTVQVDSA